MKNKKEKTYKSKLIDDLLGEISPEEQKLTDRKMMLAARIADAMEAKGMRKKDLASALRVQPSVVTKWLSGTHNFTTETLWEIGDVLGVELINLKEKQAEPVVYRATFEVSQQAVNDILGEYFIKDVQTVGKKQELQLSTN